MEGTAIGESRLVRFVHHHLCFRGWLVCCGLTGLLLADAAGQEPAPTSAAPTQTAATETDPTVAAQRLLAAPRSASDDPTYGQQLIDVARAVGRKGDFQTAMDLLLRALDHYQSGPLPDQHDALLTTRMGLTSAAWQLGKHEWVIEHASELLQLPSKGTDAPQRTAARQFLARSLQQTAQYGRALEVTIELAESSPAAKAFAAEHALTIAGAALRSEQLSIAADGYRFYLSSAPGGARTADAQLGLAWTAALGADSPEHAADQLAEFISTYPSHHDVPHALAAQAKLLRQLGRDDEADQINLHLLTDYSTSDAAKTALENYLLAAAPWPDTVRAAWLSRLSNIATAEPQSPPPGRSAAAVRDSLSAQTFARLFETSLESGDDGIWQAAIQALVQLDRDGNLTFQTLKALSEQQLAPVAEHLAVDLLARIIDASSDSADRPSSLPAASESACRWAGLMERWSLLALIAEQRQPPLQPHENGTNARQLAIDRLLAESLMQTRRSHDALPWWDAIIDVHHADDFPTLLRGAEVATAHGSVEQASSRLQAAAQAAADDPFGLALVGMLEAELAIRRARMDEARERLSAIVRATESAAELRPRAQWLIGETYFLQGKYAEAIDQYRRVEALDTNGQWAAAAMLQAGKAFEKLGRSREAATCYTALLSRFGDSPNAAQARSRLAHLGDSDRAGSPLRR